jgi:hypothetical protein
VLVYFPDDDLADGAAEVESEGFFDVHNAPPWDTWLTMVEDTGRSEKNPYLLAWVPNELVRLRRGDANCLPGAQRSAATTLMVRVLASLVTLSLAAGVGCVIPSKSAPPPRSAGSTVTVPLSSDERSHPETGTKVRTRLGEIKACYEQALQRNPTLSGRLVIRWTITETGAASEVGIEENTLGDGEVARCIVAHVASWAFPAPSAGPVEVSFPFYFQSTQ